MRAENSQITFADLEFLQQGVQLDPLLEKSGLSVTRKFSFESADSSLPEVSR